MQTSPAQRVAANQALRHTFERRILNALPWICFVLGGLGILNSLYFYVYVPHEFDVKSALQTCVASLIYFAVGGLAFAKRIPNRWAEPVAGLLALQIPLMLHAHFLQVDSYTATIYHGVYIIACAAFFYDWRWYAAYALFTLAGWHGVMAYKGAVSEVTGYAVALWQAVIIGGIIIWARLQLHKALQAAMDGNRKLNLDLRHTLQRTEESLQRLADHLPDIIFRIAIHDGDWRVTFLNPAVEDILGFHPDDIIDDHVSPSSIADPEFTSLFTPEGMQRLVREPVKIRCRHKDGRRVWLEVRTRLVQNPEGTFELEGSARDVTDNHHAAEVMRNAKDEAEAASRLKSSILANMSHEIRTPMTAILGYTNLLSEKLGDQKLQGFAETANRAGERLLYLLDGIIDLARIEADRLEIAPEVHSLAESAKRVCGTLRVLAENKNIALNFRADGQLPVHTDVRREEQVLTNLIGNAIRFTESGSIDVHVFSLQRHGGTMAVVEVRDTGAGISSDFLPHVFEEFRQESEGYKRRHEGSGLGLPIAKKLVERMGGSLSITSSRGNGTTVMVSFPLSEDKILVHDPVEAVRESFMDEPLPFRVLVVEDDEATAELYRSLLGDAAAVCPDADSALELIELEEFAVALLDIHLKGSRLDGAELAGELRSRSLPHLKKIVAVTAFAMRGDAEKFLKAGFDAYLAKPFVPSELIEILQLEGGGS